MFQIIAFGIEFKSSNNLDFLKVLVETVEDDKGPWLRSDI